jgi:uroporphyrinogen-III synthase
VAYVAAYVRRPPSFDAAARDLLAAAAAAPAAHLWLFSSSEAVRHLAAAWAVPPGARALATHARIAAVARDAGFAAVATCAPTPAAVRQAVAAAASGRG